MALTVRSWKYAVLLCACLFGAASATAGQSLFFGSVEKRFRGDELGLETVCPVSTDKLARRVLVEYGSMFVAHESIRLPKTCIFTDAASVTEFQDNLDIGSLRFGAVEIELQDRAADALERAVDEARSLGLSITPLDGAIAGRRSYADTVRIWNSRFHRALDHWVRKQKISPADAAIARKVRVADQVRMVTQWEEKKLWFSTGLNKSIFYSVAPPGTSQHLSLVAFDIVEVNDSRIRTILNRHGWFQTIRTDQPHFTYLGVPENDLPRRGLRKLTRGGHHYWIPDVD